MPAEDKRLTEIRFPLQIGTSALWSLARASVFFPGLVLVVVGVWIIWERPDAIATPVVHCIYCDKPNVLGLDLSGDAKEASEEQAHLEAAFADREKERVFWRFASLAALAMIVASVFVVRSTFADITRVSFARQYYSATVVSTTDLPHERDSVMPPIDDPEKGTHVTWSAQIAPAEGPGVNCHVKLEATPKKSGRSTTITMVAARSRADAPSPSAMRGHRRRSMLRRCSSIFETTQYSSATATWTETTWASGRSSLRCD